MFKPLVAETTRNFRVEEVSADSAYLSYKNAYVATSRGAWPFFAFKSNTTAKKGGALERMFHWYNLKREDYLAHYHKRSNVESTMSMIKAKFGDALRSKTDVAMVNEALCKVVCHNICCLIQSIHELGITATFGQKEEKQIPSTPPADDAIEVYAWV